MNYANHENEGFDIWWSQKILAPKSNIANEELAFLDVTNCMQAN